MIEKTEKINYLFKKLTLVALILCCICCPAFARNNNPEDFNPYVRVGECAVEPGYFETKDNGQLYVLKKDDCELRLKQNSIVSVSKNPLALTDELEIKTGIVGLLVASDTLYIKTPYADMRLRNAKVTIRVTKHLVRLCVIEGTAIFIKNSNFIPVSAGNEIAASKDKLSKIYKSLDDLRYAWYWKKAEEEPSLSN